MDIDSNKVARFQIRHALLFSCIFIFILVAFILLIARQNYEHTDYDAKTLQKYFQKFKNHIESKLYHIERSLRQIKFSAESNLFESRENGVKLPFSYRFMKESADGTYYHMNDISEPFRNKIYINVTGNGKFHGRSPEFFRVLQMGLNLSSDFQAFRESFPNLIYIYYISTEKLIVHNPWLHSGKFKFEESLYTYDLWKLSTPQKNPKQNVYWTNAYIDDTSNEGSWLMTSCAVPIYDQNNFIGVVGADLTVDFLNSFVAEFEPQRKGSMVIFDQDQNMLAQPSLISFKDKTIKKLKDSIPSDLALNLDTILKTPENTIAEAGKWKFIKSSLAYSPFSVLYYFPRQTVASSIIRQIGYGTLGLIACMLLLVSASFFITHQKLVHPTEKFVNFILAKSRGSAIAVNRNIPNIWKTWFAAIENVFDENSVLTEGIRQRNIELQNEIEARNKAEIEKEALEKQLI
ncbi:MAG: cache domain-containing protein, partial [Paludibacteraceae bacterium]